MSSGSHTVTTVVHDTHPEGDLGHRVQTTITQLGYPQHAAVRCDSDGSTVILTGELSSFYLTQIAQTIAKKVPGVGHVVNKIKVVATFGPPS